MRPTAGRGPPIKGWRLLAAAGLAICGVIWLTGSPRRAGSKAASGKGDKTLKELQEGSEGGGWAGSFLHKQADANLTQLIDDASNASPYKRCPADSLTVPTKGLVLAMSSEGSSDVVSAVARRVPCKKPPNGTDSDACCDRAVHFRPNTTDIRVFEQVFPWHYMRYCYVLFSDAPPKYILDAGANVGFATLLFKLLWPDSTVVSLEPDPGNFAMLQRNTQGLKNVHALNAGLWSHKANITMAGNHGNWGRIFREAKEGESGMEAFGVMDVAKMLKVPAFDFVKIDIEGAEGVVFEPGSDFSWIKKAQAVSLEVHDYFAGYFGLKEVSTRIDAAFNKTGYSIVSDNEHVMYLSKQRHQHVKSLKP